MWSPCLGSVTVNLPTAATSFKVSSCTYNCFYLTKYIEDQPKDGDLLWQRLQNQNDKLLLHQQPPLIMKQISFNMWVMIVEVLSFLNSGQISQQFTHKHFILEQYETTATNADINWPVMRTEALWCTSLTMKVTQILELHRIKMESCRSDLNLLNSHLRSAQLITALSG